jgi:hypothetical protein
VFRTEVKVAAPDDFAQAKARYDSLTKVYEQRMAALQQKETIAAQQEMFRRSIRVQGFGIYNYDILWKKPDITPVLADFDFGPDYEGLKERITVYLVTGDNRAVVSFPYSQWKSFAYSPSSDNKLLAVLPGNRMAVFTQKDFKQHAHELAAAKGQPYRFHMRVQDNPAETLNDIESTLKAADVVL